MFIVFDGIDGAGKTTHLMKIKKWLYSKKVDFVSFKEPGGTPFSNKVRKLFLHSEIDPLSQLFLLSASRTNLCKVIASVDKLVLCDRFFDSTYAYQGKYFSSEIIDYFVNLSCVIEDKFIQPDFTFLFLHSYGQNKNYMDQLAMQDKESIIDRFKKRMSINPEKYFIIQNGTIKEQQDQIRSKLSSLLNL